MFKRFNQFMYRHMISSEAPFIMRISNLVYACIVVACFLAAIITYIIGASPVTYGGIFALALSLFFMCLYFNRARRFRIGCFVMFAIGSDIFMPIAFFLTGGMKSGITNFSVLCIAVAFILFNFWECILMLATTITTMLTCIIVSYYNPELLKPLDYWQEYFDRTATIVVCGLAIGFIIKFQKMVYSEEKQKAEDAAKTKSSFLAAISHEIRTPLNAILGLAELEMSQMLPTDTLDNLRKVHVSGNTLLNIVNDILDTSKMESGHFHLNMVPYDIPSLINDTVNLNLVRMGSKAISFDISIDENIPMKFIGDEVRIKQILNNLLSNAFKYTHEGGVTLAVSYHEDKEESWLDFSVSDTGIGIKEENLKHLFKEFGLSGDGLWRKPEGSGLGLAICKKLVELMNGSISVHSVYGGGSTFSFRISQEVFDPSPIGLDMAEDLMSFRFSTSTLRINEKLPALQIPYARVLVVDDVVTNLDVAKGLMLRYGMKVDLVTSGREAVDIIRKGHIKYDAIFMDHMMPGMDGIEAVRIIRQDIGTLYSANVPIIALTANALAGNEKMFLENGFQAFLSKPIDALQLDKIINKWVRKTRDSNIVKPSDVISLYEPLNRPSQPIIDILTDANIAGLDTLAGLERFDNNPEAYLMVLKSYMTYIPELLGKIKNVTMDNLHDYTITVHGIKGSSYSISAVSVGSLASELETSAKAGDYEKVAAKNEFFINAANDLITALAVLFKVIDADKPVKEVRNSPDKELLSKLLEASLHYDLKSMEYVMSDLEHFDYRNDQELVAWLRSNLDDLEYSAIAERLAELGINENAYDKGKVS